MNKILILTYLINMCSASTEYIEHKPESTVNINIKENKQKKPSYAGLIVGYIICGLILIVEIIIAVILWQKYKDGKSSYIYARETFTTNAFERYPNYGRNTEATLFNETPSLLVDQNYQSPSYNNFGQNGQYQNYRPSVYGDQYRTTNEVTKTEFQ